MPNTNDFSNQFITSFKALHQQFVDLMELQPWTIVDDSDILAVKHPVTGELYYAYFMGELGEVVGFNLYRGNHVAPWLHTMKNIYEAPSPSELLLHTFCQLTAVKKTALEAEIKDIYKIADIKVPRGKAGYLDPLSFKFSFTPVVMAEEEILEVTPLMAGFKFLLERIDDNILTNVADLNDENECYVAVQQPDGSWQNDVITMPLAEPVSIFSTVLIDKKAWTSVKLLPKSKEPFLLHAQLFPAPYADEQGRGVYPLILLCIGAETEHIFGIKTMPIAQWETEATTALRQIFEDNKMLPTAIHVANEQLLPLANAIARELAIDLFIDDAAQEGINDLMNELMHTMSM